MAPAFTYARFDAVLGDATMGIGAGELHGLLSGYLCGGGQAQGRALPAALGLAGEGRPADAALADLLEAARPWCGVQLDGMHLGFQPLLPPDTCPLGARVDAMVEWSRGFLGGFGLAGVDAEALSADGREFLHDLAAIAAAPLATDDGGDDDERALMELVEFARVGAMLLRTEVAAAARARGHAH